MRLDLVLIDSRIKPSTRGHYAPEHEEYERAKIEGAGNSRFLAHVLRGLADELDPPPQPERIPQWERDLLRGES